MALTLKLTANVLNTYIGWHAQVLHDLHESVPYLYDNTVGDGPYNAWLDPILDRRVADDRLEQRLGDDQVRHARRLHARHVRHLVARLPDVHRRHAQRHQPAVRDVRQRRRRHARAHAGPNDTARTWYKQNPPLPKAMWSQRNNNNYQQTGLLASLNHFADNKNLFLQELLPEEQALDPQAEDRRPRGLRASRPTIRGPGRRRTCCACCSSRAARSRARPRRSRSASPARRRPRAERRPTRPAGERRTRWPNAQDGSGRGDTARRRQPSDPSRDPHLPGRLVHRPHGSAVQPHRGHAARLSGTWAPDDPQRNPYDDTGWTFGELFNVQVVRVTDVEGARRGDGDGQGRGPRARRRQRDRLGLRDQPQRRSFARDAALPVQGRAVRRGARSRSRRAARSSTAARSSSATSTALSSAQGRDRARPRQSSALASAPAVKTHPARAARIAMMHTWINTQDEGWWRLAFDSWRCRSPTSARRTWRRTPTCARSTTSSCSRRIGRAAGQTIITGMPMYGNPMPWKTTELTPNIGKID